MDNKINIAELLKDCPKGMELDCTMYENVEFDYIEQNSELVYPIHCLMKINGGYNALVFTRNGCNDMHPNAKCVIFPKGKTTWEGFAPPCKFKDGDIISNDMYIAIFYKADRPYTDFKRDVLYYHCWYNRKYNEFKVETDYGIGHIEGYKLATEEEKEKLFNVIKANGYKWNPETKTLEKLVEPKFRVGDVIQDIDTYKVKITEVSIEDECYEYESMDIKGIGSIGFSEQDNWELVPNKFDISNLKPFDKVLVRNKSNEVWTANFYSHYDATSDKPFICVGWSEMNEYRYCIPYDVNKELLGTTNNSEEYGSR